MTPFDYIIVGGGSAGCVLAARLSQDGAHRVLLLEAGGSDRRLWVQVPIGYGKTFYDPRVNWMYSAEPEPALNHRADYWPRGKVLGGSGSINAMVHVRGQAADFEAWRAHGNPGWGWQDVLPYFRKSEDFASPDPDRATGGPLHLTDPAADCHPLCETFLRACDEAGLPRTPDFNGARQEGVGYYQIATRGGRRMSAARAYLHPAMRRGNLRVETGAHATRILFDGRRAVGVAYRQHGHDRTARCTAEVILAAGAVGSPHLLHLSGVGPAALLNGFGIDIVSDHQAVGRNLQDHLCIDHLYRARVPTLNDTLGGWRGRAAAGLRYALFRRGPLAISVNQAGGFVRSRTGLTGPNTQLYFSPLSCTRATPGTRALMQPDPFSGFLLSAQPCRPRSRGRIEIAAADPFAAPRIMPNALSDEHDLLALLDGSRLLRRLAAAPSLAAVIEHEIAPGAAAQSDAALIDDIRRRASSVFHPVGTCRMGPDPVQDVVNQALKVHGLLGLRVIDASVFPQVTSGNTNAPTIMVAERGADLVLRDAKRRQRGDAPE